MFSHLYPESYTPFSIPQFSRSNSTRISSLSFLLGTKSVVPTVYFYNSDSIFATKFSDRVCAQSKKLYDDILALLDRKKCGLENGVYLSGFR